MRIINGLFKMLFTIITVSFIAGALCLVLGIIFPQNFIQFFDYLKAFFAGGSV